MKVLLCHNHYQQRGGEDQCFDAESHLLQAHGHEVLRFTVHNDAITDMNRWSLTRKTIWNRATYSDLRALIRQRRPDVFHCTNIFPLISPSAYYAARDEGVPVVQSVHNYRLFCCNALLMRDGRVCEDCLAKRVAWPGILHGCYHHGRAASAAVVAMQSVHRAMHTWTRLVDRYVALSHFSRNKLIDGGLPREKIVVKPNFVHPDPGPGQGNGQYAIFVGRLAPEKGIDTLLQAWHLLQQPIPLKIVGAGPLQQQVAKASRRNSSIHWMGQLPVDQVLALIGDAACLVMPSICYEHFPRTIAEAFAKGTPVIASRLGAMTELIDDGRTGLLVKPADAADLASKLTHFFAGSSTFPAMRKAARRQYERNYTADVNLRMLLAIYGQARGDRAEPATTAASPRSPIAKETGASLEPSKPSEECVVSTADRPSIPAYGVSRSTSPILAEETNR